MRRDFDTFLLLNFCSRAYRFARIVIFIALGLPPTSFSDALNCAASLGSPVKTQSAQWPPQKDWISYLNSLPDSQEEIPLVEHFPMQPIENSFVISDARLYTLHLRTKLTGAPNFEKFQNPSPELEMPESKYKFLGGFESNWTGEGGLAGQFILVESKTSARTLLIPGFPKRRKGVWRSTYIRALNDYLGGIEDIVAQDKRDPELDYFFRSLELRENGMAGPWDRFKTEPWATPPVNSQDSTYRKESVITASYDGGDTQRVATKETFRRGKFWITVFDSYLVRSRVTVHGETPPSRQIIETGRRTRRDWLNQIVSILYPEYANRRKWTKEFIEKDYAEVLASADRTRYVVVQTDDGGKAGETLAVMGLNRAPYEGYTSFYPDQQRWQYAVFSAGVHFMQDFTGPAYHEKGVGAKRSIHDVPVLKMENYLGIHLKRPAACDEIIWNTRVVMNGHMEISLPSFRGDGIIYEPVKFYLAPDSELRKQAATELVSAIASVILPSYRDPMFSLNGQRLYTFNPLREGKLLYSGRGWDVDSNYQSVTKDGVEWHVFAESPEDYLMKFHKLSAADQETEAGAVLQSLREIADGLKDLRGKQAEH